MRNSRDAPVESAVTSISAGFMPGISGSRSSMAVVTGNVVTAVITPAPAGIVRRRSRGRALQRTGERGGVRRRRRTDQRIGADSDHAAERNVGRGDVDGLWTGRRGLERHVRRRDRAGGILTDGDAAYRRNAQRRNTARNRRLRRRQDSAANSIDVPAVRGWRYPQSSQFRCRLRCCRSPEIVDAARRTLPPDPSPPWPLLHPVPPAPARASIADEDIH